MDIIAAVEVPTVSKIIEDLEFKLYLNRLLGKGWTFDQLFQYPGFVDKFRMFMSDRIGRIWLKSKQGMMYTNWQSM